MAADSLFTHEEIFPQNKFYVPNTKQQRFQTLQTPWIFLFWKAL